MAFHRLSLCAALLFAAVVASPQARSEYLVGQPAALREPRHAFQPPATGQRNNIVFVLTDDQDLELDSLKYMPLLQKHLGKKGTFYKNHFVTTAICCPSRVALWTGRQPHNTNVTDVSPPYGGYPKFISQGFNDAYLPVWLQDGGYNTFYTGKMFNAHTVDNYDSPFIKGFNGSDFLLDPYTYSYLNSTYQRNHDAPVSYEGQNSADVIAGKAMGFLDDAIAAVDQQPFFLGVAPVSPHSNVDPNLSGFSVPIPPARFANLFPDVQVPRSPNFNPDAASGVSWISRLPQRNESEIAYFDHFYRQRLRTLQTVDELVDAIVKRLEEAQLLDSTYIAFSSDNGFHIGQHRLPPGKECAFEEDIRVPFYLRGPGIPENHIESAVTTHIDLAPTFFEIAGLELRKDFDGTPIPLYRNGHAHGIQYPKIRHEHVAVEYWGRALSEGTYGFDQKTFQVVNNTYKAVRIVGRGYNLLYAVWCSNEHELYDLNSDPYRLTNLYPSSSSATTKPSQQQLLGRDVQDVVRRLDALVLVLKSCKGSVCVLPWNELHVTSKNDIRTLQDALHPKFDQWFEQLPTVEFSWCALGYLIEAEGPQFVPTVPDYKRGQSWSDWT